MKPKIDQPLEDWLNWLLGLHAQEIDLGLSRVRRVAERLALLTPKAKVVTVAGTNGKGSSVAMMASIYRQAGYRVGHYTSPHLLRFNERIQINQVPVSDFHIKQAFEVIEQAKGGVKLTFFEFATLAALWLFKQAEVDVMILEVGLGGRLDAVNMIDADVALMTSIDVDHIDWLGSDREKIGAEKAGILRPEQWAVTSDPRLPNSVVERAESLKAKLFRYPQDFYFQKTEENPKNLQPLQSCYDFMADSDELRTIKAIPEPALKGAFQWQNLAGVIAAIQGLAQTLPVADEAIRQGVLSVSHPGRLQWVKWENQKWLLDVAHNAQSAEQLAHYLQSNALRFPHAVFSVLNDKEVLPMINALAPFVEKWHIAPVNQSRAMPVEQIYSMLLSAGIDRAHIAVYDSLAFATQTLQRLEGEEKMRSETKAEIAEKGLSAIAYCLVWGSFFTLAEVLPLLERENKPREKSCDD